MQVKCKRSNLYHIISDGAQRTCIPTTVDNSFNFYGTATGGNSQKGWDVSFDLFPQDKKIIYHIHCNKLAIVQPYEEEKEYDRASSSEQIREGRLNDKCNEVDASNNTMPKKNYLHQLNLSMISVVCLKRILQV
jgi:hypothetical protein